MMITAACPSISPRCVTSQLGPDSIESYHNVWRLTTRSCLTEQLYLAGRLSKANDTLQAELSRSSNLSQSTIHLACLLFDFACRVLELAPSPPVSKWAHEQMPQSGGPREQKQNQPHRLVPGTSLQSTTCFFNEQVHCTFAPTHRVVSQGVSTLAFRSPVHRQ